MPEPRRDPRGIRRRGTGGGARPVLVVAVLGVLSGCRASPPLGDPPPEHPASVEAKEVPWTGADSEVREGDGDGTSRPSAAGVGGGDGG